MQRDGRQLRVELHLSEGSPATLNLPNRHAAEVLDVRQSRTPTLWNLDEATVLAADIAYDVHLPAADGPPMLDPTSAAAPRLR